MREHSDVGGGAGTVLLGAREGFPRVPVPARQYPTKQIVFRVSVRYEWSMEY